MEMEQKCFCLICDLNARVGSKQIIEKKMLSSNQKITPVRKSKDGVVDGNGRKLLEFLEDVGGIIVNGRISSDVEGELTFVGSMGKSVIDYCCCSLDVLNLISDFTILSKSYSDHMPIYLNIQFASDAQIHIKPIKLPPKLYWGII